MSKLRVRPDRNGRGRIVHVTPASAGWTHVGFDLHRLGAGTSAAGESGDREVCLVLVTGRARLNGAGRDFGMAGDRMTPFEGKPWSLYLPPGWTWRVDAETDVELAACSAPSLGGSYPARLIRPESVTQEVRGQGTNTRYVTNILPESEPADSLLVVEVITPGGHTSSYPPHKHDRDDFPHETLLEETYYHRLSPPQGFAFQRVYTDDGGVDEAIVVEDGDVVLVPEGYHPCAAIHGYDLYYLNVMAGPKRAWRFHNQPEHEWLLRK